MKSVQNNIVYTVWVGDGEVNENYIDELEEALDIASVWRARGYDDVAVEKLELDPINGDIVTSELV